MKKITILFFMLLFVLKITAQKQEATIYFKDGKVLSGLAKIKGQRIKFRKAKKAKKQFFDYTTVESLKIKVGDEEAIYDYKNIDGKKNIKLLELMVEGNLTLYRIYNENYAPNFFGAASFGNFGNGGFGGVGFYGTSYSISHFYVCKDSKQTVTHLGASGTFFTKNFKKTASKYFSDCPILVEKIQKKEFKKKDIIKIVEFYNKKCQ